jgi:hypothetical protein
MPLAAGFAKSEKADAIRACSPVPAKEQPAAAGPRRGIRNRVFPTSAQIADVFFCQLPFELVECPVAHA